MEGYKGGNFDIHRGTPIWVDNWGEWTETGIVDLMNDGKWVHIVTARLGY